MSSLTLTINIGLVTGRAILKLLASFFLRFCVNGCDHQNHWRYRLGTEVCKSGRRFNSVHRIVCDASFARLTLDDI